MKTEIVIFEANNLKLEVPFTPEQETVWLNRNQLSKLFGRDIKTIGKHINNALREELDDSTVAKFATVQNEGTRTVERDIEYYNLDMIINDDKRCYELPAREFINFEFDEGTKGNCS